MMDEDCRVQSACWLTDRQERDKYAGGQKRNFKGFSGEYSSGNLNKHSKLDFNYKWRTKPGPEWSGDGRICRDVGEKGDIRGIGKPTSWQKRNFEANFLIEKWNLLFVFNLFIYPVYVYFANQFAKGARGHSPRIMLFYLLLELIIIFWLWVLENFQWPPSLWPASLINHHVNIQFV